MSNANRISKGLKIALALRDALVAAVSVRVEKLTTAGSHVAVEWAGITKTLQTEGFANQLALLNGGIDLAPLVRMLPLLKGETVPVNYVQAKSVQKMLKVIDAFASQSGAAMGDYTVQVLYNALHNGGSLSLNGAQASLSRRVSNEGSSETLATRGNYTPGTASAQASQVREVVRVLGIGSTVKGKRNDTLTLDPARVEALRAILGIEAKSEEGETIE